MGKEKRVIARIAGPKENGKVNENRNIIVLDEAGKIVFQVINIDPKHPEKIAFEVPEPKKGKEGLPANLVEPHKYKWIASLMHGKPDYKKDDYNKAIGDSDTISPKFPKVCEGGGLAWIEPFLMNSSPVNHIPNGYFVTAKGKPEILSAEWREYNEENKGKIISKTQPQLNNSVLLDVYTQGLYGQYIDIELLADTNIFFDDDVLPLYEPQYTTEAERNRNEEANMANATQLEEVVIIGKKTSTTVASKQKDPEPTIEIDEKEKDIEVLSTFFRVQVGISKMLSDETSRPSSKQVSDFLSPVEKKNGEGFVQFNYVQKTTIFVYLDPRWLPITKNKTLKIYPRVSLPFLMEKEKVLLKDDFIVVDETIDETPNLSYSGNRPVTVGNTPINPQKFDLCKYTLVKVKDKGGWHVIFNEGNLDLEEKPALIFEIVAGTKASAAQTITLQLENLSVNNEDCKHMPKHKGHVIDVALLRIGGYEREFDTNKRPEPISKSAIWESTIETKKQLPFLPSTTFTQKNDTQAFTSLIERNDEKLVFDAAYEYSIKDKFDRIEFKNIWSYFLLPSVIPNRFQIPIRTCRWQHDIDFRIYPDIKWSLIFGFNVDKDQLSVLFPSWCSEKNIKSFEAVIKEETKATTRAITQAAAGKKPVSYADRQKINRDAAKTFKEVYDVGNRKKKELPTKGKLSVLLDIIKNIDISLKAEWDDGAQKADITDDYAKSLYNSYGPAIELTQKAVKIIEGEYDNPKDKESGEKEIGDFINNAEYQKRYRHLVESLKRPAQEIDIIYPKIKVGASWLYAAADFSGGNHTEKNKALIGRKGVEITLNAEAAPLIGMEIRWHILDLLCRRHPIAYAVLAAVKTLLTALGDNPDGIKVDFWVKGQISGAIDWKHNLVAGFKEMTAKSEVNLQAGVEIEIMIQGKAIKGKYEVVSRLGFGAGAQVGLGTEDIFGVDESGIYIQKKLIFEGIRLSFSASADANLYKIRYDDNGDIIKDELVGIGGSVEGEIIIGERNFDTRKIYFKKYDI